MFLSCSLCEAGANRVHASLREGEMARARDKEGLRKHHMANLPNNIVDFRGFDSSIILI